MRFPAQRKLSHVLNSNVQLKQWDHLLFAENLYNGVIVISMSELHPLKDFHTETLIDMKSGNSLQDISQTRYKRHVFFKLLPSNIHKSWKV